MAYAERGEVRLHYQAEGSGPAALLLPGHTFDYRIWDAVTSPLVGHGLRVIRPDLRGHGRSTLTPSGYHPSEHARDMLAVLDTEHVRTAVLVGFSLGGGVALELALAAPERVAGLVLISPVVPDVPYEDAFMANLREVARAVRSQGVAAAMAGPWLESPLFAASFERPGVRERVAALVADFPGADYLASQRDRVERSWTVPERLGELSVPTLVVVGERDMEGFTRHARVAAAGIPGAQLEVVPNAGHLLPLEEPERLAQLMIEHFGTAADGPTATP